MGRKGEQMRFLKISLRASLAKKRRARKKNKSQKTGTIKGDQIVKPGAGGGEDGWNSAGESPLQRLRG